MMDPNWIVGHAQILSSFCHFLPDVFTKADMTVNIGLSKMNISYYATTVNYKYEDNPIESKISFNEEFGLRMGYVPYRYDDPDKTMKMAAFKRGVPNAILTVAELFSRNEGYAYGRMVSFSGDFVNLCLISALILNSLGILLMVSVPRNGYAVYLGVGTFLIFSSISYMFMCPYFQKNHLRVEGVPLEFQFGRSCYVILAAGVVNVLLGIGMYLLVYVGYCDNISTFFELDYDSPWGCKELEKCMREDRIGCTKRLEEKKGLTNDLNFKSYPTFLGNGFDSTEKSGKSLPHVTKEEMESMKYGHQDYKRHEIIANRNNMSTSHLSQNTLINENGLKYDTFVNPQMHVKNISARQTYPSNREAKASVNAQSETYQAIFTEKKTKCKGSLSNDALA